MSITTNAKSGPRRRHVLLLSLLAQVLLLGILWVAAPLRTSRMQVDVSDREQRSQQVQEANRKRVEQEQARREKVVLKEKDADTLRKKAKAKEEEKAIDKLREMREAREAVQQARNESLQRLQARTLDEINARKVEDLGLIVARIVEHSYHLNLRSKKPIAAITRTNCLALQASTESFLAAGDWARAPALAADAMALEQQLSSKFAEISTAFETPEDGRNAYQHLFGFGPPIQKDVAAYLAELELLLTSSAEVDALNDLGGMDPSESVSESEDVAAMSLEELVAEAAALEAAIADSFAEMRAAEMAQLENSSLAEAMEKVSRASESASSESSSSERADSESGASERAASEGGASEDSAPSQSGAPPPPGGSPAGAKPTTVADLQNYRDQMSSLGRQATGHWTKALNMAQQAGGMSGRKQAGRPASAFQSAAATSPSSSSAAASGKGGGAPGGGGADGGSKSSDRSKRGSATAFRSRTSAIGDASTRGLRTKIPAEMIKAKALPGRRFSQVSQRQGWMFIDTWYIIGPWENEGQLAYDVTHPPEIAIDLDAEYSDGKFLDGTRSKRHPLRWTFVQSDIMRITPPNEQARSTYYASTEVYFDEPARMLVAIASDDAARMWVNGKLIWEDQGLSGWSLNEGFRVVDFHQGFNTFLVRIENSPVLCEFSVLLCPPDQVKK